MFNVRLLPELSIFICNFEFIYNIINKVTLGNSSEKNKFNITFIQHYNEQI